MMTGTFERFRSWRSTLEAVEHGQHHVQNDQVVVFLERRGAGRAIRRARRTRA